MKSDPFFVKDQLSAQLDNEERIRNERKKAFMEEQRKNYNEYMRQKDEQRMNRYNKDSKLYKITDEEKIYKPHKNVDTLNDGLYTNLTKDNSYTRGYHGQPPSTPGTNRPPQTPQNPALPLQTPQNSNIPPQTQDSNLINVQIDKESYLKYLDYCRQQEEIKKDQARNDLYLQNQAQLLQQAKKLEEYKKRMQEEYEKPIDYQKYGTADAVAENPSKQIETAAKEELCKYGNKIGDFIIPDNPREEARQEYLANKMKNVSTYSNLTHLMTMNPSLKTVPRQQEIVDPIRDSEKKKRLEKQEQYKKFLDEQMQNRPQSEYKVNQFKEKTKDLPPNPFSSHNYHFSNSNLAHNPLIPNQSSTTQKETYNVRPNEVYQNSTKFY